MHVAAVLGLSLLVAGCGTATPTASTGPAAPTGPAASQGTTPAASTGTTASTVPQTGGTLTIAMDVAATTLNPMQDSGTVFVEQQIFDNLVDIQTGVDGVVPDIAESWDTSPDGLTYTFHLRAAKFSNGDPVTAEDVQYSLKQAADTNINVGMSFLYNVGDVVIVDPATVRVELTGINPAFLENLAIGWAPIVPAKVVQSLGQDKFGANPIGSGPFMVKSFTPGQEVDLVRNPYYWKPGQPYLDGVTLTLVADDNARVLQVKSGQVNVAVPIALAGIASLKASSGITLQSDHPLVVQDVVLNQKNKGPLQDVKVRQALNYATDRQNICSTVFGGLATPANSPMQWGTTFWDPSISAIPFDLQKAKDLMAESSVPNGFSMSLSYHTGDPQLAAEALILQSEWAEIGVKVNLMPLDAAVVDQNANDGTYDAFVNSATSWSSDTPDTGELASLMFDPAAGWQYGNGYYSDPTATQLARDGAATSDVATRRSLYSQLQTYTLANGPYVPLVFAERTTAVQNNVHGFATNSLEEWNLEDAWLGN
jgi:peptide/nickel transport system substrate-binding protein